MNLLALLAAGEIDPARSPSWIWPEQAELIYGTISSLIVFGVIYKLAGPTIKKAMSDRTARIQAEMDASAAALESARAEAAEIRRAAGDIESERARLLAEADAQAAALLAEGRSRLAAEIAEIEARAESESLSASSRLGDELRVEIGRLSAEATERLLVDTLDGATQQALIESFIQKVGASS